MVLRQGQLLAAGLVSLVVGSGCIGGDEPADGSAATVTSPATEESTPAQLPTDLGVTDSVDLRCQGRPQAEPPADFDVILDAVALPASPTYPNALQTTARTAADGSVYYFAKTGLVWNGGRAIELEVPEELRLTLAIGWGGPAQPSHVVRLDCADIGSWIAVPGGYWVREPACAELIVRVGGDVERVSIGLGRPCDGQGPPAGPSDG